MKQEAKNVVKWTKNAKVERAMAKHENENEKRAKKWKKNGKGLKKQDYYDDIRNSRIGGETAQEEEDDGRRAKTST